VTLCFSPNQALMAAKAGAYIISPFIGRLDDISIDGMDLIKQIVTIYRNYSFKTQVLVASVRHPVHVVEAAMLGAEICTMPFKVIDQLIKHPLTDIGLERFLADWKKTQRP
jgi:transaldolase